MESETSSCSANAPQESSNYDEIFMQRSLLFASSLKDLKSLRKQLYLAAEYFELSYHKDDQEQLVIETLKEYVAKAIVSTVDHLGSVASKVNNFLDEKVDEVSVTSLRLSCIEQKARTYQEFIDRESHSQQSLMMRYPKYHKRYIIPVGETMHPTCKTESKYNSCSLSLEDNFCPSYNAVQSTKLKPQSSLLRKGHDSRLPPSSSPLTFSFTRVASNRVPEKRAVSPPCFSLKRSGSLVGKSIITPTSSDGKQRYPSELRRSASLCIRPEIDRTKEIEQYSKKSTRLLKALLSIHKSRKNDRLNRFWDDN